MDEDEFENIPNMPGDCTINEGVGKYIYYDRGSKILSVAHLDYIGKPTHFAEVADRIYSPVLDDRLGAYTILWELRDLECDVLLTTGEESGMSTAFDFDTKKQYNWIFEFDRRGIGVVMYQYETAHYRGIMQKYNFKVENGSFSDIAYLEELGCIGFNFGTAYYDEHTDYSYMDVPLYTLQLRKFRVFFNAFKDKYLEHENTYGGYYGKYNRTWKSKWSGNQTPFWSIYKKDYGYYTTAGTWIPCKIPEGGFYNSAEGGFGKYNEDGEWVIREDPVDRARKELAILRCLECGSIPTTKDLMIEGVCQDCWDMAIYDSNLDNWRFPSDNDFDDYVPAGVR